jgi:hypothetical protein
VICQIPNFNAHVFSVAKGGLTAGVDCNNICYMLKPSEIAKFSRIFDDSSMQWV